MTWLGILNFALFQWFGVRLARVIERRREADRQLVLVRWAVLRWIWPLTGWWSAYRWITRRPIRVGRDQDKP